MAKMLKRVVIKEELVALTGDAISALILNQCLYWHEIVMKADEEVLREIQANRKIGNDTRVQKLELNLRLGWFWKSAKEMHEEIMISTRQTVDRKLTQLVEAGYLSIRKNPNNSWDRTNQYKVNIDFLQQELHKIGYSLDGYALPSEEAQEPAPLPIAHNEQSEKTAPLCIAHNEQSNAHHEQAITEITTESTFITDDDDIYIKPENEFFIQEFIEIAKAEDLPEKEIKQIINEIAKEDPFTIDELNSAIKQTLNLWEKEPVNDMGKLFAANLRKEKRRMSWKQRRSQKDIDRSNDGQPQKFIDSNGQEFEFTFYNWLEDK